MASIRQPEIPPTTDELRAAFERCYELHFYHIDFEKAMQIPGIPFCLEQSALAYRHTNNLPAQPRLF